MYTLPASEENRSGVLLLDAGREDYSISSYTILYYKFIYYYI